MQDLEFIKSTTPILSRNPSQQSLLSLLIQRNSSPILNDITLIPNSPLITCNSTPTTQSPKRDQEDSSLSHQLQQQQQHQQKPRIIRQSSLSSPQSITNKVHFTWQEMHCQMVW